MWATKVLKEYIVMGFALNDDLLKRAGSINYFDGLLARIRDIRSSEKGFYRKVLEILDEPRATGRHMKHGNGGRAERKMFKMFNGLI